MKRKRPSLFSILLSAFTLAFAFRRTGKQDQRVRDRLKPQPAGRPQPPGRPEPGPAKEIGHDAETPSDIPPLGWWQIAKRTAIMFNEHELMSEAAGVTFYALLSLVPAITAVVSLYGLVSDPHSISTQLDALSGVIPSGGMEIISEQVKRLAGNTGGLGLGLVIGVGTALWSANAATKAMFSALNDVYGQKEDRGFFRLLAVSMAFTLGGVVTMILGLVLVVVLPVAFKAIGLDTTFAIVVTYGRVPVMLAVIVLALALLYRYGPRRQPPRWRWVTWGGVFGAVAWVLLSVGFSWYVSNFGSYNKTYGSLGAIVGFMTWIWLSTTVLLLGAQLNAEMEQQTARDTTTGEPRPLGERGAAAADRVA